IIGLAIFTVSSLLCALSGDVTIGNFSHIQTLFAARALQGLGGSIMLPLSLAIISSMFQGKQRGTAIGLWGGTSGLAIAIGPVVGGVLVQTVNWQSIFYLNVPIGVVGIGLSAWAIRESRDEGAKRSIDVAGLILLTVGLFCLLLALIQGNDADKGWTSGYILTLFAIAAVALITFVAVELRLENPMVDPRLFLNRSFTAGAAVDAFVLSAGLYSLFFFLALFFQNALGFGPLDTGIRFLPMSAIILLASPIAGNLMHRLGAKPLLVAGLSLVAIGILLLTVIAPHDTKTDWVILLPGLALAGLGSGIVNPPIATLAVSTVSRERAGMASGVSAACRQVGIAFGIALLGAILTSRYNGYVHDEVTALNAPHVTAAIKQQIIAGVQRAGAVAGSTALKGDPSHPNPFAHQPLAPTIGALARAAFIKGLVDILRVAALIVAIGVAVSLFMVRRSDIEEGGPGGEPAAAG
ncbi:MAG TPA: DHA2 family efflux MFS transporter permease subunit, partial [Chloroflexota bacterium]